MTTLEDKRNLNQQARNQAELLGQNPEEVTLPYPEVDDPNYKEGEPTPSAAATEDPLKDISEEQLLKALTERSGVTLSSLQDLEKLKPQPTPEELAQQREERKKQIREYGISTGKVKPEDLEQYDLATANRLGVIKQKIEAKIRTAYPEWGDDLIEEKVAQYTFENLDPTDPIRLEREQELLTLADVEIQQKFKNIVTLEPEFDHYQAGQTNKANLDNKVKAALPVYKQDISNVVNGFKSFTVPVTDTKNDKNSVPVNLELSDTDVAEIVDLFLQPDTVVRLNKNGYTLDQLKGEVEMVILKTHFPRFINQAAKGYNSIQKERYIKGVKGALPAGFTLDVADEELDSQTIQKAQQEELLQSDKTLIQ